MSKCCICGNELMTGDIHWSIGVCNTCYDKTCKSEEQKYVDMLNKESSELLVNSLAEKDQQIAELQKQLEEKEKIIQMQQNIKRFDIGDMLQENIKLKQQLKSQSAEIVEKIREIAIIDIKEYGNNAILYKITGEDLDSILKE